MSKAREAAPLVDGVKSKFEGGKPQELEGLGERQAGETQALEGGAARPRRAQVVLGEQHGGGPPDHAFKEPAQVDARVGVPREAPRMGDDQRGLVQGLLQREVVAKPPLK